MAQWNSCIRQRCILNVLCVLFVLSGCATAANLAEKVSLHKTPMPTECSGWEKLELKSRTRYDLMRSDARLLMNIDAHNLRGRNLGCWP